MTAAEPRSWWFIVGNGYAERKKGLSFHLQELALEFSLNAAELGFCLCAAGAPVILDLAHFFQCVYQMLVGLLERLKIDDAPLGFLGDLYAAGVKGFCVVLKKIVCDFGDGVRGLHRLLGMIHAQRQDHLLFPERDRVDNGGLDLFGHEQIVVLDHADLRPHLERDHPGQLQVVQLLLEAADKIGKIIRGLGVFGETGFFGFLLKLHQFVFTKLLGAQLSGNDVHGEFFAVMSWERTT